MPWLLNVIYACVIAAAMPWLLYQRVRWGKYRTGWGEKLFGRVPDLPPATERVWFHAVSVGEVLLLRGLIAEYRQRRPDAEVVLTTTTVDRLRRGKEAVSRHDRLLLPARFLMGSEASDRADQADGPCAR